ncbi:hypothetical protein A3K73_01525 [Candidatus Pacearchaeota archaeon RBG_13_36_9]|nr:MAG: hypothetical protein A3K73_01525 [Candidatus Pacearchaeota archaeon RBG_13_36_9]
MKKHKKFSRIHKSAKILGAILLGAMVFSGGALAMPLKNSASDKGEAMTLIKNMAQNDINCIDQWNKEFSDGYEGFDKNAYLESFEKYTGKEAMNEGAVSGAIKNSDYEEWKEATQNLEGYPKEIEPIPKEEFETLVELKKAELV